MREIVRENYYFVIEMSGNLNGLNVATLTKCIEFRDHGTFHGTQNDMVVTLLQL